MNNKFTDEQIEVYAKNFREGDAIWVDDKWHEVGEHYGAVMLYSEIGVYVINHGETVGYNPVIEGFRKNYKYCKDNTYRVTTLENYKLQGGEKIVRLDDTSARVSFGKSYTVSNFRDEDDYFWTICDNGERFYIDEIEFLNRWGVIPRYEKVKDLVEHSLNTISNDINKDVNKDKNNCIIPTKEKDLINDLIQHTKELLDNRNYEESIKIINMLKNNSNVDK